MTATDQTHLDKRLSLVDDYATDGRPDTMKILPSVREQLRKAQEAYAEAPSLDGLAIIRFWMDKLAQYSARARARKS